MDKKAIFFSADALIALIIILITLLTFFALTKPSNFQTDNSADIILSLSNIKIGDLNNDYARQLIQEGKIQDPNKSVLEQIGEFYANGMPEANGLAQSLLTSLDSKENIGIYVADQQIASTGTIPFGNAKDVKVSRQIISGIQQGNAVKGYSSRAFLYTNNSIKYFYFGGYTGEGNISAQIILPGTPNEAKMELATNTDFDLFINGIFSGRYQNSSSSLVPKVYDLNAYLGNIHSGTNTFKFSAPRLYIAGGYIKVGSDQTDMLNNRKYLPGVDGIINLYDGLYIPGSLQSMNIFLHLNSNYSTFLNIGNTTVFKNSTSGEKNFTLTNSVLSSLLNYNSLGLKTVPIRLSLENVSYVVKNSIYSDVFSVTDLSGSMIDYCTDSGNDKCCKKNNDCTTQQTCTGCGYEWIPKLTNAKLANNAFIDGVLNYSGNLLGLVPYSQTVLNFVNLTNNAVALKANVSAWTTYTTTCICCGINKATTALNKTSSSRLKSMVVMSDGMANMGCPEQGTPEAWRDAVLSACQAYQNYGIRVYAVGFGADADTAVLKEIARCGNGTYYDANISSLVNVYATVASDIIKASYVEQTINSMGNITTKLYPDSYIELNYTNQNFSYGLILNLEQPFSDASHANFVLPNGTSFVDARVVSYSGSKWTDSASINGISFYNLSNFGREYIQLGDPYAIEIPLNLLNSSNNLYLTTGLSPTNSSLGSIYDKIIYSVKKQFTGFSKISPFAKGCKWTIQFDDLSSIDVSVPSDYSGTDTCTYTNSSVSYNANDAISNAVFSLLSSLDLRGNHTISTKFSPQEVKISSNEISGIPFSWYSEIQVRKWR